MKLLSKVALFGCIFALNGCTIAPKLASNSQASFDQGVQDSGILSENPDHSLVVTPHLRDRYNALIADYGRLFKPPVGTDQGITPTGTNTFVMNAQAFEDFAAMNRWRKQGAPPWFKP